MTMTLMIILFFCCSLSSLNAQIDKTNLVKDNPSLIQKIEAWYEDNTNYYTITALMAVESSFIPFPSEIVIPPAAYIASKPDSDLNIFLVILFGTIGAIIGAIFNYYLALWLGRPIIYKFADSKIGHLCLLSKEKIQKAEEYFVANGNISTLVGRLLPGIRQLISIPAGLAKMNMGLNETRYQYLSVGLDYPVCCAVIIQRLNDTITHQDAASEYPVFGIKADDGRISN